MNSTDAPLSLDENFRIMELAASGFQCSQILLALGLEAQGKHNPDLVRAMSGLAGGIGFTGNVCGALTGAACLLGLYAGRGIMEEEEDARLLPMIEELVDWFTNELTCGWGGVHCRDIVGDDPNSRIERCPQIVTSSFAKVKSLLAAQGFDLSRGLV